MIRTYGRDGPFRANSRGGPHASLASGFCRLSPCRGAPGAAVRGPCRPAGTRRHGAGARRDRHRGRCRLHGRRREPGGRRRALPRRQRDRRRRGHRKRPGRDHPVRSGAGRRRLHGDLPGQDPRGGDDRRPRELPGRVHADHVHRPEDRTAARLRPTHRTSRWPPACPPWWPPGPRRSACTAATAWPPTCSRPSAWPSAGSASTPTSSSSPSPACPNCRPTRPATGC